MEIKHKQLTSAAPFLERSPCFEKHGERDCAGEDQQQQ
jgi:hypothetical protein